MRRAVLARLVLAMSALSGIGVWVACGGSDDQDVVTRPTEDSGSEPPPEDDDTGTSEPEPLDAGTKDTGPAFDPGDATVFFHDGGEFAEAGIPCFVGGALEVEPNDTALEANEFGEGVTEPKQVKRILCGAVLVPDAGGPDAGEADWLKFDLGDASTGFYIQYHGEGLRINVETDGQAPTDITQAGVSLGSHKIGQPYYVEVKSVSGKSERWAIVVYDQRAQ